MSDAKNIDKDDTTTHTKETKEESKEKVDSAKDQAKEAAPGKEELEAQWKEAFNMLDKDGSGSINTGELGDVLKSLGLTLTDEEL